MIYESPDNGKTVYARLPGSYERILVSKTNDNSIDYPTFLDLIAVSKEVPALQKALENVIIIYKLAKENE